MLYLPQLFVPKQGNNPCVKKNVHNFIKGVDFQYYEVILDLRH